MNNRIIGGLLILSITFIAACNKTEDLQTEYPLVSITSPASGQAVNKNAVHIKATVSAPGDNEALLLHEVSVTVKSLPDSAIVFSLWKSAHALSSYTIDTTFATSATGNMLLVIKGANHMEKTTTQSVVFPVQ